MPGYPEIYGTRRNGVEYRFRDDGARQQVVELGEQIRAEHDNDMADLENEIESLTRENEALRTIAESAIVRAEKENDALVHYNYAGEMVGEPITGIGGGGGGGGGGGDSSVYSTVTMTSETEWTTKTIRQGASCPITVSWSSTLDEAPTGNGSLKVNIGTKTVLQRTVAQGRVTVDVGTLLKAGTNSVRIQVTDVYGISKYRVFTVVCEQITISSSTDFATPKSSQFTVTVTPVGSMSKVIHFKLDGIELSTIETSVTNRPVSKTIPAQAHGAHSLEIWYTAELNGEEVESNRLYYEFVSFVSGNTTPVIVSNFNETTIEQYSNLHIEHMVYNPVSMKASVDYEVNDVKYGDTREVERKTVAFDYRVASADPLKIAIKCGAVSKVFNLTVIPSSIHPEAATDQLALHLDAAGRSNNEANPAKWEYGSGQNKVSATFTGFNFVRDGWISDENGIIGLRCLGGSGITIPFQPYASDPKATGKTIEIEFKTNNVLSFDSPVISCMNGDRGFAIYADHAVFKSSRSEIITRFTTDQRLRITMTLMPRNADVSKDYRILYIYIDGEYQKYSRYSENDNFVQGTPVGITVGMNAQCGVDIYNIRIYNRYLDDSEVLMNYTADRQDSLEMADLYTSNDVMENGKITIEKLPPSLPYVVFEGPESPQYKGDKKTVKFTLYDLYERNRTIASGAIEINVQGTSSQYYYVKNFKIKLKNGAILNGTAIVSFSIRDGEIAVKEFTLKADVASSESANNILFAKLFNDLAKRLGITTPPQQQNSAVRQAVDGFPCVIFWDYGDGPEFIGKYNFNNDKGTFDTFGFSEGDEAWDVRSNTSQLSKFHTATLPENWYTEDYESIYPEKDPLDSEKPYSDATKIQAMTDFIYSTWQENATGDALAEPVTYEGTAYTNDTAAYRLAKFKAGFPSIWSVDNAAYYYCFCLTLMMVDSFQKNQHYVYWHAIQLWWIIFWDGDTALGTDNRGGQSFEYWVELFDKINNENVFNGADNVMWVNFTQAFWPQITAMFQRMRSSGMFSAEYIMNLFHEWQAAWPKAIWNADGDVKCLEPLRKEGSETYLPMGQGSKRWQRDELLPWRFAYVDSLMDVADAQLSIMFRPYYEVTEEQRLAGDVDIEVEVYKKCYVTVLWDSTKTSQRVVSNTLKATVANPLRYANDAVCAVHNAKMIKAIKGLENLYVGYWDSTNAPNIQEIVLGSPAAGYSNTATEEISVGTNDKLTLLDLRNCVNYGTKTQKVPNLSHCPNIKNVYLDGTKAQGVDLPNGGVLEVLHLPDTVSSIVLLNHPKLTDQNFVVEGWTNVEQLWLENMSGIDMLAALNHCPANTAVRLVGFTWECANAAAIETILDKLDTMRGIDVNAAGQSVEVDKAQVSGTIHTFSLSGSQIASYRARYPYITFDADNTSAVVTFKDWDGSTLSGVEAQTILNGGNATDPTHPTRTSTAKYDYTFVGWAASPAADEVEPNGNSANQNILNHVVEDITLYAAYSGALRSHPIYYALEQQDGGGTIATVNTPYGSVPVYSGQTPTTTRGDSSTFAFQGWKPALSPVTGPTTYYAVFADLRSPIVKYLSTRNLETYESDDVTAIGQYAFYGLTTLQSVTASALSVAQYAFSGCTGLEIVDLTATDPVSIAANAFNGASNAKRFIIRSSTVATLANANAFTNTGRALIYVPDNLVASYKAASPWSSIQDRIYGISDIGVYEWDETEISDTDEQIFAKIANGTAATAYKPGNYKTVNLGAQGSIRFQIAGFNMRELANSTDKALVEWVAMDALATDHRMNPAYAAGTAGTGTLGGMDNCEMYTYINTDILALFPEGWRNAIKETKQYTRSYTVSGSSVSNELTTSKLRIPSMYEVGFSGYESQGPQYTKMFPSDATRIRKKAGSSSAVNWWLRSANYTSDFNRVNTGGSYYYGYDAQSAYAVLLSFST